MSKYTHTNEKYDILTTEEKRLDKMIDLPKTDASDWSRNKYTILIRLITDNRIT